MTDLDRTAAILLAAVYALALAYALAFAPPKGLDWAYVILFALGGASSAALATCK